MYTWLDLVLAHKLLAKLEKYWAEKLEKYLVAKQNFYRFFCEFYMNTFLQVSTQPNLCFAQRD